MFHQTNARPRTVAAEPADWRGLGGGEMLVVGSGRHRERAAGSSWQRTTTGRGDVHDRARRCSGATAGTAPREPTMLRSAPRQSAGLQCPADRSSRQGDEVVTSRIATRGHARRNRAGLVAAALALTAAGAGGTATAATPANGAPTIATVDQIKALAAAVKHPIYWLGPRANVNYELSILPNGKVFIRYLPKSVKPGDRRAIFKTVGTYPVKNAASQLRAGAKFLKRPVFKVGATGIAVVSRPPTSAYVVFGSAPYQIEVFTPSAALTKRAVNSVVPVS